LWVITPDESATPCGYRFYINSGAKFYLIQLHRFGVRRVKLGGIGADFLRIRTVPIWVLIPESVYMIFYTIPESAYMIFYI
jgi:hypothetical protein